MVIHFLISIFMDFLNLLKKNYGIIATTNKNNKRFGYLYKKNKKNYVNAGTYVFFSKKFLDISKKRSNFT